MQILTTAGKSLTTASADFNKSISTIGFESNVELGDLTTETISIKVVKKNGTTFILKEDIPVSEFVQLGASSIGVLIGRGGLGWNARVPLCVNGNIPLSDNDVITFVLKGLKSNKSYALFGYTSAKTGSVVMTYERKTSQSNLPSVDFLVEGYDKGVLKLTDDVTDVDVYFSDSNVIKSQPVDEFVNEINQLNGVIALDVDSKCVQQIKPYLNIPLFGISKITLRKTTPVSSNEFLLRNNLLQ